MVTNELRGEKVDIVPFSEDPAEFVLRALQPAKVKEVRLDDQTGTATVIVHDFQLSLAIGKEGQNARLAARLTGWRVDIKSETQLAEEEAGYAGEEWAEGEWVQNESGDLVWQPAEGGEAVSAEAWSLGESPAPPADKAEAAGDGAGAEGPTEGPGAADAAESDRSAESSQSAPADPAPPGAAPAGEEVKGGEVAAHKAADEEEAPA
jgi:N utilization substance protein A